MKSWVYMLLCEDGSYYTGWTTDVEKRYTKHCNGKGAKYTRVHHPLEIAFAACYDDKKEAMRKEYRIKQLSHCEKEKLALTVPRKTDGTIDLNEILRRKIMSELKFYKCNKCGKIIAVLHDTPVPTMCCGEAMTELTANTTDAAQEKHVPVIIRENGEITARVGSVDHPMIPEHYIEFIAFETDNGFRIAYLKPGEEPAAKIIPGENVKAVYAYCNLHGLWKTEA